MTPCGTCGYIVGPEDLPHECPERSGGVSEDEVKEAEANYFARCLLMPRPLVERWMDRNGGLSLADDSQILQLAEDFQVPIAVAGIRIGELLNERALLSEGAERGGEGGE